MATKSRLEAVIDSEVKAKAVKDAKNGSRSLSGHVEHVLKIYPDAPKAWADLNEATVNFGKELDKAYVPKKEYKS